MEELESDLTCPVCKSLLRDPFVSACGHAFCYACVSQHLGQRKSCPTCTAYLTFDLVFPNFALQRLAACAISAQRRQRISLAEQVMISEGRFSGASCAAVQRAQYLFEQSAPMRTMV